ncbi:hypothetical protein BVRB_2g035800 [Beta vulgaris subsp. vulgaris]|nr:hypothetical protein BVRB_2g035800 [Beta vulgaris subsp. vulgaris]
MTGKQPRNGLRTAREQQQLLNTTQQQHCRRSTTHADDIREIAVTPKKDTDVKGF